MKFYSEFDDIIILVVFEFGFKLVLSDDIDVLYVHVSMVSHILPIEEIQFC